jgi:hypothetical protein
MGRATGFLSRRSATSAVVFGSGLSFSGFGLMADLGGSGLPGAVGCVLLHGLLAGLAARLALGCLDDEEPGQT